MHSNKFIKCPGCKALVMDIELPIHRYLGTVPGCWNLFTKVLTHYRDNERDPLLYKLIVDTYSIQHPGKESALTIQALAIHLIRLYFFFERNQRLDTLSLEAQKTISNNKQFHWLIPPKNLGRLTIDDVYKSMNFDSNKEMIMAWSESAWLAWSQYHPIIKKWISNGSN